MSKILGSRSSNHYDIDTSVKTIQQAIHCLFSAAALAGGDRGIGDGIHEAMVADDFDKMAAVVDWLDACRGKNLDAVLDFYAESASLECVCEGRQVRGRSGLIDYWRPKLSAASPDAFSLEEITPVGEGVLLDYLGFEGKPIRITFAFDAQGKILHTACRPR